MKWVVLVIVICLGVYTFLTLRYRKQSPTFEPYEDMKTRANTVRLLSAGFQRIAVEAQRPADATSVPGGAAIAEAVGGLPTVLRDSLIDLPVLPADYTRIAAAPRANPLLPTPSNSPARSATTTSSSPARTSTCARSRSTSCPSSRSSPANSSRAPATASCCSPCRPAR